MKYQSRRRINVHKIVVYKTGFFSQHMHLKITGQEMKIFTECIWNVGSSSINRNVAARRSVSSAAVRSNSYLIDSIVTHVRRGN